jgi:hypothetical protein
MPESIKPLNGERIRNHAAPIIALKILERGAQRKEQEIATMQTGLRFIHPCREMEAT